MANRHIIGVQLIISEMHIGTVRYFLTPVEIAIAMVWIWSIHSPSPVQRIMSWKLGPQCDENFKGYVLVGGK